MSTNYKAQLHDVITVRQAIERLVVYLGRRGGWFTVSISEADALGQTHFRPKEWTEKAKELLANAFVSGEVNLLVRLASDVPSFEPIPPEKLSSSKSFGIALPGDKIIARTGDSLCKSMEEMYASPVLNSKNGFSSPRDFFWPRDEAAVLRHRSLGDLLSRSA